ncbi:MAG: NAD(P)/FAD-dependent oxidoreductase [Candidatus Dormibacteraeota bacterium]|nr:NAD(P)/FAD-dependent oxidoreductase [Candidatus Dormibacteraeota bacterium]
MAAASPEVDVAVIGAGPAGSATALFAARAGRRVAIFDQESFPRDKPCGEGLMPVGRAILRELGIEGMADVDGAPAIRGIQFGLAGEPPTTVPFPAHPRGSLGLGVRRLHFDALLVDALARDPRITFYPRTRVLDIRCQPGRPAGVVTDQGEFTGRVVAVADGLRSAMRHRIGRTIGPLPPHRYGIVGHLSVEGPPDPWVRITVERGMEVYEAPVEPGVRLVALLCDHYRMKEFAGQLEGCYRRIVATLRPNLQGADLVGPVRAVGPFRYRATTVAADNVFLVGDAAGFSDPITGEGLAAAFRQAQAFATSLDEPSPEGAYRRAYREITRDPRRVAALLLYLRGKPGRVRRGVRGLEHAPQAMTKLLGVNFGYWGFGRLTPREWLALFSGR